MPKFRIELDLTSFLEGYRSRAYVYIRPEFKYIECLQNHIENLFRLSNTNILTTESIFLHPNEEINVINKDDVLKIVPCESVNLPDSPQPNASSPNDDKPAKSGKVKKKKKSKDSQVVTKLSKNVEEMEIISTDTFVSPGVSQCTEAHKRKRTRRGKRKKKLVESINATPDANVEKKQRLLNAPHEILTSISSNTTSNKHIRFDEDDSKSEKIDTAKNIEKPCIGFRNFLETIDENTPRIIHAITIDNPIAPNAFPSDKAEHESNFTENGVIKEDKLFINESTTPAISEHCEIKHTVQEATNHSTVQTEVLEIESKTVKCENDE